MKRKTTDPADYAGVYQRYEDIPPRHRLRTYAQQYRNEDTWRDYLDEILYPQHEPVSDNMRRQTERASQSWLSFMEQTGTHHALATPQQANEWCGELLSEGRSVRTCYEVYYIRVYQFYDYLKENSRHPHLYNPLLLAAIEYEQANKIWKQRVKYRLSD